MQKKLRAISFILLVAFTAFVTGACGVTPEKTESTTAAGSQTAENSTESSTEEIKPPVTVTIFAPDVGGNFVSGIQDDPVAKWIENKLNIKMDIQFAVTNDKFAASLASGDLPDLINTNGKLTLKESMIKSGAVIDLEPLVETNGPEIKKNASAALEFAKKYQSFGTGKLYALPAWLSEAGAMGVTGGFLGTSIRWDYYKELGAPEIKTEYELIDLLAEMMKRHPTNEDGKKTLGINFWFEWGWYNIFIGTMAMMMGINDGQPIGTSKNLSASVYLNHITGEIIDSYFGEEEKSPVWRALKFWNYAYRKGALDMESFTMKYENVVSKMNTAQSVATSCGWLWPTPNKYLDGKGFTGKGYTPVMPVQNTKNNYMNFYSKLGRNDYCWSISSKCKIPDRVMDLLNWFYSVEGTYNVRNGVQDEEWTVDSTGKHIFTDAHFEHIKDPDMVNKYGIDKYRNFLGVTDKIDPETNQSCSISYATRNDPPRANVVDSTDSTLKDMYAYYKTGESGDRANKLTEILFGPFKDAFYPDLPAAISTGIPDDLKIIDQSVSDYMLKKSVDIVKAPTEEAFNAEIAKVKKDVKAMGIEKVAKYWMDEAVNAKAILDSLK